jgi:hypothetical protein
MLTRENEDLPKISKELHHDELPDDFRWPYLYRRL